MDSNRPIILHLDPLCQMMAIHYPGHRPALQCLTVILHIDPLGGMMAILYPGQRPAIQCLTVILHLDPLCGMIAIHNSGQKIYLRNCLTDLINLLGKLAQKRIFGKFAKKIDQIR